MRYLQHEDRDILIPQHISKQALYSAQFILMDAILAFVLKYYGTGFLLSFVYVTTLLHWRKVYRVSVIKTLDILFASMTLLNMTWVDKYRFSKELIPVWDITFASILSLFVLNEVLFYYQVVKYKKEDQIQEQSPRRKFGFFSLKTSKPNTEYREYCYQRNVYMHMICIHIIPTTLCAFCAIVSQNFSGAKNR